jgi:hypothetical protein
MKLVKLILNALLFAITFCVVSAATFVTYNLVAIQTDDTSARINISDGYSENPDVLSYFDDRTKGSGIYETDWYAAENKKSVWMFDNYAYWVNDIKANVWIHDSNGDGTVDVPSPNTKLRVSNWFSWKWWKTAGKYIDVGVNAVVSVAKPILMPGVCADELKTYYGMDLSDFRTEIGYDVGTDDAKESVSRFSVMSHIYFGVDYVSDDSAMVDLNHETAKKYDLAKLISSDVNENGKADIFDMADDYNEFYQILFKLYKYNMKDDSGVPIYHKYFVKFVTVDANGNRTLKASVYGLFFLQYINIILSLAFCWLNPIDVERDETTGSVQAKNSVFRRMRWKHKGRRRKGKHDDGEERK